MYTGVYLCIMVYTSAYLCIHPIARPVRATLTLYPIGRPIRAIITLYPIARPVRGCYYYLHRLFEQFPENKNIHHEV